MNNVINIKNCFGCGVCSASCPKGIISVTLNEDGFYEPYILNLEKCINCGICLDVCSYNHHNLAQDSKPTKSWAAWSNDERVRRKCSSGGIGFEIGKQLIEQGYKAIGCRYDINKQRAEHYIANTVEEFVQSIGSKYIQSYTEEAFKQIDRKGQKYLVTGTPCQIDSFRRMIMRYRCEDNFVLMDFFCHCVPSMWAWRSYTKMLEPQIGKVTYASWRNKFEYGWHDNWLMGIDGEKTSKPVDWCKDYDDLIEEKKTYIQSRLSRGDLFYELFLGDVSLGPQCTRSCRFKYDQSSADIRIGDLWGKTYNDNQDGVSALVAFSQKGESVIGSLKDVNLIEQPFEIVAEGQMKENAQYKPFSQVVMNHLKAEKPIDTLYFKSLLFFIKAFSKIKRILKR